MKEENDGSVTMPHEERDFEDSRVLHQQMSEGILSNSTTARITAPPERPAEAMT